MRWRSLSVGLMLRFARNDNKWGNKPGVGIIGLGRVYFNCTNLDWMPIFIDL